MSRAYLAALAWGFAEATLFFVIPDVLLTFLAAERRAVGLRACGWALAGALAGGLLLHAWGAADPATAERVVAAVPQVGTATLDRVRRQITDHGALALALGPLTATPYKTYALEAGVLGMPRTALAVMTVPSRLVRFLLAAAIAGWLFTGPLSRWPIPRRRAAVAVFWVVVYGLLWALVWSRR